MEQTFDLSNRLFRCKLHYFRDGIMLSHHIDKIVSSHLASRPFHINVIEAACRGRFKETGHSLVLANLLKHPVVQSSFLETFLDIRGEYMPVTAEKDRIDVALKGKDRFVIIENKVNAAGEQKSQLYRYVHEIGIGKYGFDLSQIYVVYLNPHNRTPPSPNSLCDDNNENNVFEALGKEHYVVRSYKYDITDWLRELSIEDEPLLSSALCQYIDFLENKFHTSPKDEDMNNEIKDFLLKELQIADKPYEEQIAALNNQRKKVDELLESIEGLKVELSVLEWKNWKAQIEEKIGQPLTSKSHSFGVQLRNQVWLGLWDGYDEAQKSPYWGFQLDNYRKSEMSELFNTIKKLSEKAGIEEPHTEDKNFIAWCTTKKGVERFLSLYQAAQEMELL